MYYYFYEYFDSRPILEFRLLGKEDNAPTLLDVTSFLYDFNLAYEISRLATDPEYESFSFSRYAFYRNGRPLHDDDRLRVAKLHHESPIELVTGVAAVGGAIAAMWAMVQTFEKLANFRLNREKLRLDIAKARSEQQKDAARPLVVVHEEEAHVLLQKSEAMPLLNTVQNRLQASSIKVEQLEVRITRRTYREGAPEGEK